IMARDIHVVRQYRRPVSGFKNNSRNRVAHARDFDAPIGVDDGHIANPTVERMQDKYPVKTLFLIVSGVLSAGKLNRQILYTGFLHGRTVAPDLRSPRRPYVSAQRPLQSDRIAAYTFDFHFPVDNVSSVPLLALGI